MATISEKLYKWSLQELSLVSEGGLSRIPDPETLKILTKGRNKKVWNYVINHVRSQSTVDKVKRTLFLKKQLKEQQDNSVYFAKDSTNIEKLRDSLSKASEKRKYLMCSLSTIEERIVNLDQNVRKTKDEVFQINQKTALLEHLNLIYSEKNLNLKNIICHISSYQSALNAYQTSKLFDKIGVDLTYDFLYKNKVLYDKNMSRIKDLVIINSGIFKKLFNQDDDNLNTLKENFSNNFTELKSSGLHLIDLILILKEMSRSDLQQFKTVSSQNLSVKDCIVEKSKKSEASNHLTCLKCDFIYNSLCARKIQDKIETECTTSKVTQDVIEKLIEPNDLDYEMKVSLLEMQAENDALIVTNNHMDSYLESIACKTESVLKNVRCKKMCNKDVTTVMQMFYKDTDLVYNLFYAYPSVTKKVINYLIDIKVFASENLFDVEYPEDKNIECLKECFSSERKQTWDYCTKTKLIEPFFAETSAGNELSPEVCRSLNLEPYQNIGVLCENWSRFKQKLYAEIAADSKMCVTNCDVSVSEIYSKILKLLEKMKFSIEKAMISLTYGTSCCKKSKTLIDEWWNQNAQYIPHIEYEGKTLKMWIDILLVLSDFQLQSHT